LPKDWAYESNGLKSAEFSPECISRLGFRSSFLVHLSDLDADLNFQFSIGSSGRSGDSVIVRVPSIVGRDSFARGLLEILVGFWRPRHAVLTDEILDDALDQPIGDVRVGWVTYFSDKEVLRYLPPGVDVRVNGREVFVGVEGGYSISENSQGFNWICAIIKALAPTGLLKSPG
jgi:hypothetical protein